MPFFIRHRVALSVFIIAIASLVNFAHAQVPQSIVDLALEPPEIVTAPGPEYSDEVRTTRWSSAPTAPAAAHLGRVGRRRRQRQGLVRCHYQRRRRQHVVEAAVGDRSARCADGLAPSRAGRQLLDRPDRQALVVLRSIDGLLRRPRRLVGHHLRRPRRRRARWSAPRRIWHGATLNKPLVLKNGEWLMPISLWTRDRIRPAELRDGFPELDDQRMANLFVSTDQGQNLEAPRRRGDSANRIRRAHVRRAQRRPPVDAGPHEVRHRRDVLVRRRSHVERAETVGDSKPQRAILPAAVARRASCCS